MLSSHLFLCLPLFLFPSTVPCRAVFASPANFVKCSYHFAGVTWLECCPYGVKPKTINQSVIPLWYQSLYCGQKIFIKTNCGCDPVQYLCICDVYLLWDVKESASHLSCLNPSLQLSWQCPRLTGIQNNWDEQLAHQVSFIPNKSHICQLLFVKMPKSKLHSFRYSISPFYVVPYFFSIAQ